MKKALLVAGGIVTTLSLGVVGLVVFIDRTNPRDEAAYLTYLKTYGSENGNPISTLPPSTQLVAEGDSACDWLAGTGYALWRTSAEWRNPAVAQKYETYVQGQPPPWGSTPSRGTIAAAAWGYLCPATVQMHKPHYLFSDPTAGQGGPGD